MKKDSVVAFLKNMFGGIKNMGAKADSGKKAPVESIFLGEEASIPDYLIRLLEETDTSPKQGSF